MSQTYVINSRDFGINTFSWRVIQGADLFHIQAYITQKSGTKIYVFLWQGVRSNPVHLICPMHPMYVYATANGIVFCDFQWHGANQVWSDCAIC